MGLEVSMKKFALLALMVSSLSFATSIRSISVESIDTPLFLNGSDETAEIIRVAADGEVFGGTCGVEQSPIRIHPPQINIDYSDCKWTTVKYLNRHEILKVSQWTKKAVTGAVVLPAPGTIYCMAMPTRHLSMTANNGTTLLREGNYPCAPQTYNSSDAAQKLVKLLNELRAEYNKLVD